MKAIHPLRLFRVRAGFSLVEVLLAIFILGIGIISIAALFPAGIAQQRLANEDVMGPIVANNAISLIRSKVKQEDFGTYEEYQQDFPDGFTGPGTVPQPFFSRTQPGDWDWMRPGFLLGDDPNTVFDENGAIDIFSYRYTLIERGNWSGPDNIARASEWPEGWPEPSFWNPMGGAGNRVPLYGIPFNTELYFNENDNIPEPPKFIISQRERYYPMQTGLMNNEDTPAPQYVWDCMFRRYQGKVYVAIFVYRVSTENSGVPFVVPADENNPEYPPLPYWVDLTNPANADLYPTGAWNINFDNERATPFVSGTADSDDFDVDDPRQSWQRNRQWVLDQNNNIHRVVGTDDRDEQITVELSRPLQQVMTGWWSNNTTLMLPDWPAPFNNNVPFPSDSPYFYYGNAQGDTSNFVPAPYTDIGVVTDLWYIPRTVDVLHQGQQVEFTLTPVYVTVKEL